MRVMVITSRYPSPSAPYNHMFVHERCRAYLKKGVEVNVFVPSASSMHYQLDGVPVNLEPADVISSKMHKFDGLMVHLLHPQLHRHVDGARIFQAILILKLPTLIFLHGIEIQGIFRNRRDDIRVRRPRTVIRAAFHDFYRLPRSTAMLAAALDKPNCRFIAPSKWFLDFTTGVLGDKVARKGHVIPNGIDTELFPFRDRVSAPSRLLTIRPLYQTGKYALDLALEIMTNLPKNYTLDIFGQGPDEKILRKRISHMGLSKQVRLYNTFVQHTKLPELHRQYGAYLGVTRMDAQGVSMCEAMASGLPVISFRVAAIPEIIQDRKTGLLAAPFDTKEAAHLVTSLESGACARKLAVDAREAMERINIQTTTALEMDIMDSLRKGPNSD